ncbi:MAG: nuclear transport factor 2 family protein [Lysobacteraceae bacterium]|nr:MAG: nuclear transport factor 2 family protein [Xanthomonadaceae bacterium]
MDHRQIATEFLRMCARGAVREAYARFVADDFVHHNAWFAGDRESLLLAMEQSAAAEPNKSFDVKQVIDGGDRVAVLSHLRRASVEIEYAVVHIVRIEGGKIVELWDVGQEIPKDSPNSNGMF